MVFNSASFHSPQHQKSTSKSWNSLHINYNWTLRFPAVTDNLEHWPVRTCMFKRTCVPINPLWNMDMLLHVGHVPLSLSVWSSSKSLIARHTRALSWEFEGSSGNMLQDQSETRATMFLFVASTFTGWSWMKHLWSVSDRFHTGMHHHYSSVILPLLCGKTKDKPKKLWFFATLHPICIKLP